LIVVGDIEGKGEREGCLDVEERKTGGGWKRYCSNGGTRKIDFMGNDGTRIYKFGEQQRVNEKRVERLARKTERDMMGTEKER
jgi:hypothetical protein